MSPESVSEFPPQPSGMSEISRLTGVFFEPAKAFEDIAARPSFWVPLLLTIVSALIFTYLLSQHLGWPEVLRQSNQMNPRATQQMEQLPADQQARAQELQLKFVVFGSYGGAILGRAIFCLIVGLILLGIVRGIMSAPVRFKQIFAILCYASLPSIIQAVLTTVVMFLKKPEDFNLLNPLVFNLGFIETNSKFLHTLASAVDLFTIWTILLVAVGLKAAGGRKLSFAGALIAVVLPWGVIVLIRASIASVFS
jgi:hypothetical protein